AVDKMSGIDRYEILEEPRISFLGTTKKIWKLGESPYLLEDQSLRSKISVKAIDKAGNERIVKIIPPYKISWKDIVIVLLILIGIGLLWRIIKICQKYL
ncbi:hypothetical protein AMJ49_05145, partial [Parcubacteria bacterium DG_74_2]